jgi:hypothetical protein
MPPAETIALLEAIIALGFTMRVRTKQAVRDGIDVTLVIVEIGDDFTGDGLTPSEALMNACAKMREKVAVRHQRDTAILDTIPAPVVAP